MNLHQVVVGQVTTEKSVRLQENNQFAFFVHPDATKIDIKNAFKKFWGANVDSVRMARTPKKVKLVGRGKERTKRGEKAKAYIQFKKGTSFEVLKFAGSTKSAKKAEKKAPAKKDKETKK